MGCVGTLYGIGTAILTNKEDKKMVMKMIHRR
jgi:hypothetical protein